MVSKENQDSDEYNLAIWAVNLFDVQELNILCFNMTNRGVMINCS